MVLRSPTAPLADRAGGMIAINSCETDIDRKVAFLSTPKAYAEPTRRVERVETHLSWVFLTDSYVYKLKKPLRGDRFDFSSCDSRRRNAEDEVRLNRRLAPDVYIGVMPLTLEGRDLAIAGRGVITDWLVKMVRLPAERMLDQRLARGDWHHADIHALADRLARFFATASRVRMRPTTYLGRFDAECRSTERAFRAIGGPGLDHAAQSIARRIEAFIDCRRGPAVAASRRGTPGGGARRSPSRAYLSGVRSADYRLPGIPMRSALSGSGGRARVSGDGMPEDGRPRHRANPVSPLWSADR